MCRELIFPAAVEPVEPGTLAPKGGKETKLVARENGDPEPRG